MSSTPEEIFRRMIDLMLAKDMNAVADLWAPDGVAEFPFAGGSSLAFSADARRYAPTSLTIRS